MGSRIWIFYSPVLSNEIWYTSTATPSVSTSWATPAKFDTPYMDDISVATNAMVSVGMWSNNAYLAFKSTDPLGTRGLTMVRFLPRSNGTVSNVTRAVAQNDLSYGDPPGADFVGPSLSYMANQNFFFVNDNGYLIWKQRRGR